MGSTALHLLHAGRAGSAALVAPDGSEVSYAALTSLASDISRLLDVSQKALVACLVRRDPASIAVCAAALGMGHAVLPFESQSPLVIREMCRKFTPDFIASADAAELPDGYLRVGEVSGVVVHRRTEAAAGDDLSPELAMLLRTSGSLGPPKAVRLSYDNLASNASAIADVLSFDNVSRGVTTLPIDFSFGLSIVNSHLFAGASLLVTDAPVISPAFWSSVRKAACTDIAAVPFTYRVLDARGWDPSLFPSLRLACQAGGGLAPAVIERIARRLQGCGSAFVPMYGQTEATARIACMPPGETLDHIGSAGVAVPGGRLSIEDDEIVYEGPNVMLGYAASRADLSAGDHLGGRLRTGDIGSLRDGYLYVVGRRDRDVKVLGRRVNLDAFGTEIGPDVAVVADGDDRLVAFHATSDDEAVAAGARTAAVTAGIAPSTVVTRSVAVLPRTPTGKVDYGALSQSLQGLPAPAKEVRPIPDTPDRGG